MLEEDKNIENQEIVSDYPDYESQIEEFNRLGQLRNESENLREERTYKLSAGGLCLTFITGLFLIARDGNINFAISTMLAIYVLCLLINYISHKVSLSYFDDYIAMIINDIREEKPYDDNILNERYAAGNKHVSSLNWIVEKLLIINIIFSVVYFISYFI